MEAQHELSNDVITKRNFARTGQKASEISVNIVQPRGRGEASLQGIFT